MRRGTHEDRLLHRTSLPVTGGERPLPRRPRHLQRHLRPGAGGQAAQPLHRREDLRRRGGLRHADAQRASLDALPDRRRAERGSVDPLWLAETLAMIDVISEGRLVSGWVRGTGRESVAHNAQSPYNWDRFQEAHDFVMKAWSTPGPFRWEGEHYQYRYVNPGLRPYQQPHPQVWIPGVLSRNTVEWCARNRLPYVMLATRIEPTKQTF